MATLRTQKGSSSRKVKGERESRQEALLLQIKSYLIASKTPAEDWRLIKEFVEDVAGFPDVKEPTPESAEDRDPQGFKDEPMAQLRFSSRAAKPVKSAELLELLQVVVQDPEGWLSTPNAQFGGRKPQDLVGTAEEPKIFDLLHAVDQGLF